MADVRLANLSKRYGATRVIHDVSVDVADGEFVALVGPSGCGKSTLLRMVAGLEAISDGEISIGGRVVNDLAPRARNVAMVFQSYALYPHKTVEQNIGYPLKIAGLPRREIAEKVAAAADILDLAPLLKRKPAHLSGGQRQRVAMGRAIVRDPSVFLFDEPLSNLDAKLRVQMRTEIKALHQRLGTTTLYVTHDQIEAMTMADRIVIMNAGRVEQTGSPLDLYDAPDNLFVAGFLGSPAMNFLPGRIAEDGRVFRIEGGGSLPLPAPAAGIDASRDLVLGVRPEHVRIERDREPGTFGGKVLVTEPTGSETLIFLSLGAHEIAIVAKERLSVRPGDALELRIGENAHLFDAGSGARIAA